MSKPTRGPKGRSLFKQQNGDWTIEEKTDGTADLISVRDPTKRLTGMRLSDLASLNAVVSELARFLAEQEAK